jgi:hypothetical protein
VKQNYQTVDAAATALGAPESVTVAIGEVIADVREGLLAMAGGGDVGQPRLLGQVPLFMCVRPRPPLRCGRISDWR